MKDTQNVASRTNKESCTGMSLQNTNKNETHKTRSTTLNEDEK